MLFRSRPPPPSTLRARGTGDRAPRPRRCPDLCVFRTTSNPRIRPRSRLGPQTRSQSLNIGADFQQGAGLEKEAPTGPSRRVVRRLRMPATHPCRSVGAARVGLRPNDRGPPAKRTPSRSRPPKQLLSHPGTSLWQLSAPTQRAVSAARSRCLNAPPHPLRTARTSGRLQEPTGWPDATQVDTPKSARQAHNRDAWPRWPAYSAAQCVVAPLPI